MSVPVSILLLEREHRSLLIQHLTVTLLAQSLAIPLTLDRNAIDAICAQFEEVGDDPQSTAISFVREAANARGVFLEDSAMEDSLVEGWSQRGPRDAEKVDEDDEDHQRHDAGEVAPAHDD